MTSLTLAVVTQTTPAAGATPAVVKTYTGLEIEDLTAELVGIDDLTAKVYDGDVSVNMATDSSLAAGTVAQKLNWDTFAASSGELPDLSLVNTTDLAVSGSIALDLFGFVAVSAHLELTKGSVSGDDGEGDHADGCVGDDARDHGCGAGDEGAGVRRGRRDPRSRYG